MSPSELERATYLLTYLLTYLTKARGHYLGAHCDDRQLSGLILCNLSLGCAATMTYTSDKSKDEAPHRVELPRRSLQLQTQRVRFEYAHGIAAEDLQGERRVSITFRKEIASKPKKGP